MGKGKLVTLTRAAWAVFWIKCWTGWATESGSNLEVVVQSLCRVWLFVTPWNAARQASLSFTIFWSLLKLMSIESIMSSNHLILCHPFLLVSSIFPSIRDLFKESALCIRWPKFWSFSFSISPSIEYSWLISLRVVWSCCPRDSQESSPASKLKASAFSISMSYVLFGTYLCWNFFVYWKTCLMIYKQPRGKL